MRTRSSLPQDSVDIFRNVFDLHTGHGAILAPVAPKCKCELRVSAFHYPREGVRPADAQMSHGLSRQSAGSSSAGWQSTTASRSLSTPTRSCWIGRRIATQPRARAASLHRTHLARLISEVMVKAVLDRIPGHQVDLDGVCEYRDNPSMTGLGRLPVAFTPGVKRG